MKTGLSIGEVLYPLLKEALGSDAVYPLVAVRDTPMPYIVFERVGIVVDGDKCEDESEDSVGVSIHIVATTYSEAVSIAERVRQRLNYESSREVEYKLTGADEGYNYDENTMIQTLRYEVTIGIEYN